MTAGDAQSARGRALAASGRLIDTHFREIAAGIRVALLSVVVFNRFHRRLS